MYLMFPFPTAQAYSIIIIIISQAPWVSCSQTRVVISAEERVLESFDCASFKRKAISADSSALWRFHSGKFFAFGANRLFHGLFL